AREVADAVAVGVEEAAGVDLVDDGAAPPLGIGHTGTITDGKPHRRARRGWRAGVGNPLPGPPAVPVAAGLARRASIGRGYGSGAPSRPSGGAYVFIGSALQRHEPHGLATAAAQAQLQHVAGADFAGFVDEGEGLVLPVRAVAVAIDLGAIAAAGIEEGQRCLQYARGVVADRAEEPLLAAARLA